MYKVYHIRLKGETDTSLGYIGVTKQRVNDRMHTHRCDKSLVSIKLQELSKDKVEVVVLASFSDPKEAYGLARTLRPTGCIGWNTKRGGSSAALINRPSSVRRIVDNKWKFICPLCDRPLANQYRGARCLDCRK